jgi:hypothetical protein
VDYRIFFNRKNEQPQVWSLDEGDQSTEINISSFLLHNVSADSHWDPSVKPNPDTPSAWITVIHCKPVRLVNGVAHLFHDSEWRTPSLSLNRRTPEQQEEFNEREVERRINETP